MSQRFPIRAATFSLSLAILSVVAFWNCGSKDVLEPIPLNVRTDTLIVGEIGPFWPTKIEGDCEFSGHGPMVVMKAGIHRVADSLFCSVYMYVRETESNWSTAEGYWDQFLYKAPHGWRIVDHSVHPDSCEAVYIDASGAYDVRGCPGFRFRSMGDTGGNDICGHTMDDTHLFVGLDTLYITLHDR